MALKIAEIRDMSLEEAEQKISELKAELAKEKALIASGTRSENPGKIKSIRKTIARILTVVNEKKHRDLKKKKTEKEVKK